MNKETKKMLHENNILEKQMSKKSNQIYTDMIVYMRGSDISEYNQEIVRKDIIEMIISGEKRGDQIEEIIGDNYKKVCDEIISVFPNKTMKEKTIDCIEMTLSFVCILGLISVINVTIDNLTQNKNLMQYSLTLGEILNALVIVVLANIIVNVICKNTFKKPIISNKVLRFFVSWLVCMGFLGCMLGSAYFLDFVVVKINSIVVMVLCIVAYIIRKIFRSRY